MFFEHVHRKRFNTTKSFQDKLIKFHKTLKPSIFKVRLSPPPKKYYICFNESPLKMMKNAFYFIPNILRSTGNETMKFGQLI